MSITVAKLIEKLQEFPQDAIVIIQKDSEGNGYSPAVGAQGGMYIPETTWFGEFYDFDNWSEFADLSADAKEDDPATNGGYKNNAVVLWPTN